MKIVFDLPHFDYIIGQIDHIRVSFPPGDHNRYANCPVVYGGKKIADGKEVVFQGHICLIQNHQVESIGF